MRWLRRRLVKPRASSAEQQEWVFPHPLDPIAMMITRRQPNGRRGNQRSARRRRGAAAAAGLEGNRTDRAKRAAEVQIRDVYGVNCNMMNGLAGTAVED
jgi:hypothetical protein